MALRPCRCLLVLCCLLALPLFAPAQPPQAKAKTGRLDRHGVPLPEGAVARLGHRRFYNSAGVYATTFSPDGKIVLAVGPGQTSGVSLIFWETATGREVQRFSTTGYNHVRKAVFSPDGKTVALNQESALAMYDWRTGKLLRTYGKDHDIYSFAFSPDGTLLAAGCLGLRDDYRIRVWEVATGRELPPFAGCGESFRPIQFSADGKHLLTGDEAPAKMRPLEKGFPGGVCVWDVATRKKLHDLPDARGPVAFAPDGQTIAQGWKDGQVQVRTVATNQEVCRVPSRAASFGFTPDGKALVTWDANDGARLWDAATGKELRRFQGYFAKEMRWEAFPRTASCWHCWTATTGRGGMRCASGTSPRARKSATAAATRTR